MSGTSIIAQIFRSLMHVPLWCDFFKISYAPCNVGFKNLILLHVNNKGADQPTHPHSLISTFVVRSLQSIVANPATYDRVPTKI